MTCWITFTGGGGGGIESPVESRLVGSNLPQLNAQEVVDALSKWDGMEDTIALFNDLIKRNGIFSYNVPLEFPLRL